MIDAQSTVDSPQSIENDHEQSAGYKICGLWSMDYGLIAGNLT